MGEYHDCESRASCDEVRLDLDGAQREIERLRAWQNETAKAWTKVTESQEQEIERLRAALQKICKAHKFNCASLLPYQVHEIAHAALVYEQNVRTP